MKFIEFQRKYKDYPLIHSRDVVNSNNQQAMLNQIRRWQSRKLLFKLKKGIYMFAPEIKSPPDTNWVANRLYEPSYISLEYALSFYGMIPERVEEISSITSLKTMAFNNCLGRFVYRHIKREAFRGYRLVANKNFSFFMAEPEKALADFLYLHLREWGAQTEALLAESYRLQNLEELDESKLIRYGAMFTNKKLMRVIDTVLILKKEGL